MRDTDGEPLRIVHHDINPSNILLSIVGQVKLADFGVAKATNRPGSVQSRALKGKIPYMAPEYSVGRTSSPRSDLFSLGVLLYECLAGFRPYDGGNDIHTLEHARTGQREPLHEHAADAPPALIDAIESLLAPDPTDRPLHAGALLDRLQDSPPPPLAERALAALVCSVSDEDVEATRPGLASTRPASTRRPRKVLRSRG